jgi:hypothetical protein
MALITNSILTGVADRLASQVDSFKTGFNGAVNGGTRYYIRVHNGVGAPAGDYDVENALITPSNTLDQNTFSGTFFRSTYQDLINALDTHVLSKNAVSFNSYLNVSGIDVHPNFDEVWKQVKSTHLLARNVFFSEANIPVATFTSTGSGTGTYAEGTGISTNPDSTYVPGVSNYGATKMIVVPNQTVGSDIVLNVRLVKENLAGGTNTDSDNITIAAGTTSGTQFPIKSSLPMLDVSNVVAAGGDGNDVFTILALRERDIAL